MNYVSPWIMKEPIKLKYLISDRQRLRGLYDYVKKMTLKLENNKRKSLGSFKYQLGR